MAVKGPWEAVATTLGLNSVKKKKNGVVLKEP